jgi:hypothetical protein
MAFQWYQEHRGGNLSMTNKPNNPYKSNKQTTSLRDRYGKLKKKKDIIWCQAVLSLCENYQVQSSPILILNCEN